MYYTVATKMVVSSGTPAYTQAVDMSGANGAMADIVVFTSAGGTARFQEGNDLENWSDAASDAVLSATSFGTSKATAIASRYMRIKFTATSTMIVSAGINTAQL